MSVTQRYEFYRTITPLGVFFLKKGIVMEINSIKWITPIMVIWAIVDCLLSGIGVIPLWVGWIAYGVFAIAAIIIALWGMNHEAKGYAWAYVGTLALFGVIMLLLTFFLDIEPVQYIN